MPTTHAILFADLDGCLGVNARIVAGIQPALVARRFPVWIREDVERRSFLGVATQVVRTTENATSHIVGFVFVGGSQNLKKKTLFYFEFVYQSAI